MVEKKKSIMEEKIQKIKKYKESNEILRKQIAKSEAEGTRLEGIVSVFRNLSLNFSTGI
jgi:hypothetical protein